MEAVDTLSINAAARWRLAGRRAVTHSPIVWPPLAVGWVLVIGLRKHAMAFDFEHAYLPAARDVLAGHSPYPPATIAAFFPKTAFIYPPLTAYLAAPFTLVSPMVADAVVSVLAIALVIGILWLLDVRDWRCYTVAFLWVPTYSAIQTGNVTLLLTIGLALLWRYRSRTVTTAVVTGALIALKLFFWPLLIWLVVTRRFRAAGGAVVTAAILVVVPWAGIGFAGMTGYPHLLSVLTRAERADGYSIPALLSGGLGWRTADLVGIAIGLAVLTAAARLGRRDERRSFALAIASVLLLTPIIGMHYFVFLLIVLALYTPRFGWTWAIPLLFWVGPQVGNGAGWQTAAVLAVAAGTFVLATRKVHVAARKPQPAVRRVDLSLGVDRP
jgi:alpha-1,2-mannosyltransferase